MALLSCRNFKMEYVNTVLQIPSFKLESGQLAFLRGNSTSGITELLLFLGGLIDKQTITKKAKKGEIRREEVILPDDQLDKLLFRGQPVYQMDDMARAKELGFIFDNPELAIFGRSVEEEYLHSLASCGVRPDKVHSATRLFRYGLGDRLDRTTSVLSGGEMQRLNCACALDRFPSVLIADFTRTNLDADFLQNFMAWVQQLCSEGSAAIIAGIDPPKEGFENAIIYNVQDGTLQSQSENCHLQAGDDQPLKKLLSERVVSAENVLEIKDLCRPGITSPISFSVKGGSIHILTGPNGSGKTTAAQFIVGHTRKKKSCGMFYLYPKRPPAFSSFQQWKLARDQDCRPFLACQFPERSVMEMKVDKELPDETLRRLVGLPSSVDQLDPILLNSSQRKLLSIGSAIFLSRKLVILDEPTCGLDAAAKKIFVNVLNHYSNGLAFLIITHDEELLDFGERTVMAGGVK